MGTQRHTKAQTVTGGQGQRRVSLAGRGVRHAQKGESAQGNSRVLMHTRNKRERPRKLRTQIGKQGEPNETPKKKQEHTKMKTGK